MSKKVNKISLPKKILALKNIDKSDHEYWDEKHCKNIANFPCPSRICCIGPSGVGKTTLVKNILLNARPLYDKVVLVHPDIEVSKEYEDLECTDCLQKIPPLEYFDYLVDANNKLKSCIIIDDVEFTGSNKDELRNLGLIMRYLSTHRNMTVIVSHQDWFGVPAICKKMSNVYIIYKPKSRTELSMIENRCGVEKGLFKELFNTVASGHRDNLCYDLTENTPAKLRLNLFDIITIDENPNYNNKEYEDDENEEDNQEYDFENYEY